MFSLRQSLNTGHANITLSCQHGCLSVVNTIPLCLGSVQIHSRDFSLTFPDQLDSVVAMRDIGSRQIARDIGSFRSQSQCTAAAVPPPFRLGNPALYGSHPLVTP